MHGQIRDRLEDYLSGAPGRKVPLDFEQHLHNCEECREEVSWMQEQSRLLRSLVPSREMDPAPGFYARVMDRIERQQQPSVWGILLDPVFGWRLATTALAVFVLLAGYLTFSERREAELPRANVPAAIMVNDDHPPLGIDRDRDRETTFVTLATYSE